MSSHTIEHPVPYSDAMMRARLANLKKQTRRVGGLKVINAEPDAFKLIEVVHSPLPSKPHTFAVLERQDGQQVTVKCLFGKPGGYLWTREAWRIESWDENSGKVAVNYRADGFSGGMLDVPDDELFERYWIQSGDDAEKAGLEMDADGHFHWETGQSPCRWRPPMFMPRFASRGLDEIVNIRLERLQDISPADCWDEGIRIAIADGGYVYPSNGMPVCNAYISQYRQLWEAINGDGTWHRNDWVWVIDFEVVK